MNRKIDLEQERIFENENVLGSNQRKKQEKFFWAVVPKLHEYNDYVNSKIRNKIVLEIGCSNGESVKRYAKFCKKIIGIDLSDEGIKYAKTLNIKNAKFYLADAHHLPFQEKVFDIVIVNSMLHHLDLNLAFRQIHRVLKTDGKLYAREPLGTNIIISIYRWLTPDARTKDERPFTFQDLKLMKDFFIFNDIKYIGFLSLISPFIGFAKFRNILLKIDDILAKSFFLDFLLANLWRVFKKII